MSASTIVAAANAHTAKTYGPDRIFGFSPIPAMSMVSYAAGSEDWKKATEWAKVDL